MADITVERPCGICHVSRYIDPVRCVSRHRALVSFGGIDSTVLGHQRVHDCICGSCRALRQDCRSSWSQTLISLWVTAFYVCLATVRGLSIPNRFNSVPSGARCRRRCFDPEFACPRHSRVSKREASGGCRDLGRNRRCGRSPRAFTGSRSS